jgi:hypothetical protein
VASFSRTSPIAVIRRPQREYLTGNFSGRRVPGGDVPSIESVVRAGYNNTGRSVTASTIRSKALYEDLAKVNPPACVWSFATPLLAPLIENDGDKYAGTVTADYTRNFDGCGIDAPALGFMCHPLLRSGILLRRLVKACLSSRRTRSYRTAWRNIWRGTVKQNRKPGAAAYSFSG